LKINLLIITLLILGHIISDFYLQNKKLVERKNEKTIFIFFHSIHFGIISIIFNIYFMNIWLFTYILLLTFSHFIIDYLKIKITHTFKVKLSVLHFIIDQILHITIIVSSYPLIQYIYIYKSEAYYPFSNIIDINVIIYFVLLLSTYLFIIKGACILIVNLLKLPEELKYKELLHKNEWFEYLILTILNRKNKALNTDNEIAVSLDTNQNMDPKYGTVIGILERLIILTLVITNNYSAITFVVAIKAIARFKELQENKNDFVHYFIVGTLGSFFISIVSGIFLRYAYLKLIS
jgi:hypothetical protein